MVGLDLALGAEKWCTATTIKISGKQDAVEESAVEESIGRLPLEWLRRTMEASAP